MTERNSFYCKYVEICTHHVGSIGAPSRRTVFIRGKIIIINIESRYEISLYELSPGSDYSYDQRLTVMIYTVK
jgi:hypothetical protein